ncbi:hypothetical protein GMORB2_1671 [Geosmithia morbida]|uniref:Uncharacterized protein n=1 Tax=Geosmithia morbida TaxID=1094350 RepID=A0A9P5D2U2_9HYPO|nr:uncharacterized protein GMORB2_1671 [Geosmithia morbida]KAF4121831.1 hypothetical protein GMORB2_1671 [Geosmithia morbida]
MAPKPWGRLNTSSAAGQTTRGDFHASTVAQTPAPDSDVTQHRHGLDIIYDCATMGYSTTPRADIVAVHGINGHSSKTWTADNGVNWLRHLLPRDVPDVRIMTWGYDANTTHKSRVSSQTIDDHAIQLVSDLSRKRTLERALIHSDAARPGALVHHRSVRLSTYGVIFVGTPHRGADGISRARMVVKAASAVMPATDILLANLHRDSPWLKRQLEQYRPVGRDFATVFFYEKKMKGGDATYDSKIMVVPYDSAVVPGQTDAKAVALDADNRNMVRFTSSKDANYVKISGCLRGMVEGIGGTVHSRWKEEKRIYGGR